MTSKFTKLAIEANYKKQKCKRNTALQQLVSATDGIKELNSLNPKLYESRQFSLLDGMADQGLMTLNLENNKFINLLIEADETMPEDPEFQTDQKNVREIIGKLTDSRETYRELLKKANLLEQKPVIQPTVTDPTFARSRVPSNVITTPQTVASFPPP